jgi:effector-binding domain-containing protein
VAEPTRGVELTTVEPLPAAVRDGTASRGDLAGTIRRLLDDVWAFLREAGDLEPGHNIVVYRGALDPGPAPIEVGVQVGRRFDQPSPTGVRCGELPAGRAAHVTHCGPYDAMAPSYEALARWARDGGQRMAGVSWEVYGDWHPDPDQLEVDIYALLAPE